MDVILIVLLFKVNVRFLLVYTADLNAVCGSKLTLFVVNYFKFNNELVLPYSIPIYSIGIDIRS